MKTRVHIGVASIVLFLSACAGGTVGGLLPGLKTLKGKIQDNTLYVAPGEIFRVELPHPPSRSQDDKYEWTYTKVREINDGPVTGAVFGPAAFDQNLYHAVLIQTPMDVDKSKYAKDVFEKKISSRQKTYKKLKDIEFKHNGRQVFYSAWESSDALLVLSLIDGETYFFALEIDVHKGNVRTMPSKEQIMNKDIETYSRMLNSLVVAPDQSKAPRLQN